MFWFPSQHKKRGSGDRGSFLLYPSQLFLTLIAPTSLRVCISRQVSFSARQKYSFFSYRPHSREILATIAWRRRGAIIPAEVVVFLSFSFTCRNLLSALISAVFLLSGGEPPTPIMGSHHVAFTSEWIPLGKGGKGTFGRLKVSRLYQSRWTHEGHGEGGEIAEPGQRSAFASLHLQ